VGASRRLLYQGRLRPFAIPDGLADAPECLNCWGRSNSVFSPLYSVTTGIFSFLEFEIDWILCIPPHFGLLEWWIGQELWGDVCQEPEAL